MVIILKIKIPEIFNDYLIDIKKYYRISKNKLKKIYRTVRYHWNNPKSKFGKKVIPIVNLILSKINLFFERIYLALEPYLNTLKNALFKSDNRKRNLALVGGFAVIFILALVSLPSFAIYQDQFEFPILGGVVGDKYASQFDYTLLIYVEEANNSGEGSGTYNLTSDIPTLGYTYSGYNCKNDSTLIYDEETKFTSVTLDKKDICSVYFDLNGSSDITLKIMLEDAVESNTYSITSEIPYYGYKYSHYECDNNSTLYYDSNLHKVKIEAANKDLCSIYFQKEQADLEVQLFVENTYQSKNYKEALTIPSGNNYVLNEANTECLNVNNERIETIVSYTDGYIDITSGEMAYCKVYLDLANE